MIKNVFHVVSAQITELFSQVVAKEKSNFGMLKDNVNMILIKTCIVIGSVKLDTPQVKKLFSLLPLVGTEDLRYGVNHSKSYIPSKLIMKQLMLYLLLQLVTTLLLVVKTALLKCGILKT